jgi:UDP-hydrolysing UDP-N-acetyl-D-glucosamine 2-epimerase
MARRVCVVTSSRADYGLLQPVMHELRAAAGIELQVVVTGMHLAPEFGMTVQEIERDGFTISRRVEMLLASDTAGGVAKSIALGVIGMSDALEQLAPDIVLLLGDRFETLAAAQACLVHNVLVAHIAGGDTSEGAFDESIRHAVTKMAHVHFVTNRLSAQRVRQLGEDPQRIHIVGSPGLDQLHRQTLLGVPELEEALGARLGGRNLLVTFHPVTLEEGASEHQLAELLAALGELEEDIVFWFTRPNADTGGRALAAALDAWAAERSARAHVYSSLGQTRYLSLMSHVDAVVGNSSSGLYEAPSLGVPTVDIGARQRGRLAAASVMHCVPERGAIGATIRRALSRDCGKVTNPYGDGHSAERIVGILRSLPPKSKLLRKHFHLLEPGNG